MRPVLLIDRTLIYPNGTYREISRWENLKYKLRLKKTA